PAATLGAAPAHRRRPRRAGVSPSGRGAGRGVADQAAAVPDARHARASPLLDPVRARGPGHDLEPPAAASDGLPLRRRIGRMADFLPCVRRWFDDTFAEATRAQREGWDAIASGRDTLIVAPTGSGKTLAAFLWAIDHLCRLGLERQLEDRVYVVYVSPLRALNNDCEKSLRASLAGIRAAAAAQGLALPELRVAVRTGDTLAAQRQAMTRRPPHVLITTPESLFILLTSERFRPALAHARFLIVDEIHA